MTLFAGYRYSHVFYTRTMETAMRHLFIKTWDEAREVTAYPPPTGVLAVYTQDDFYDHFDYAVDQVSFV